MRRKPTIRDVPAEPAPAGDTVVSGAQEIACASLMAGETIAEAAEAAGVHRATVSRWVNHDPQFRALLNSSRRELRQRVSRRLEGLTIKAVSALERALDNGDGRVAIRLLAGLGLLTGDADEIGSDDPNQLAAADAAQEHRAGLEALMRGMLDDAWADLQADTGSLSAGPTNGAGQARRTYSFARNGLHAPTGRPADPREEG